ncbi:MAG: T9SS type A sorting domain-containing protein [Crocinitomicaceae bacterium]
MKKLLLLGFLFFYVSLFNTNAQTYAFLGFEIQFPSSSGASDGKIIPQLQTNYNGNLSIYAESSVISPGAQTDSIVGLDSTSLVNHGIINFFAIDDQSGDTLALCAAQLQGFATSCFQYNDILHLNLDSLSQPIDNLSCNGSIYISLNNTYSSAQSISETSWRSTYQSGTPFTIINSIDSVFVSDSLCSGQYQFIATPTCPFVVDPFFVALNFYISPLISQNSPFNVNALSYPSSGSVCTGSAIALTNGAVSPLTYYWDGTLGTDSITNLCPGLHTLKVIDSNNDSTSTVFGVADSSSYFNGSPYSPADTLFVLVENCNYNYNIPTDSVTLDNIQGINSNEIIVDFSFWQNGTATPMTDTVQFNPTSAPYWFIDITVYCLTKQPINSNVIRFNGSSLKSDLGNSNIGIKEIVIYPNPANEFVVIEGEEIDRIQLINSLGQNVLSTTQKSINVSDLPEGVYFVQLYTLEGKLIKVEKLIVE